MKSTHTISTTQLYDLLHRQLGQAAAEGWIQYLDSKTSVLATKEEVGTIRTELKEAVEEKFTQESRVLATKGDVADLKLELKGDIADFKLELKGDIAKVKEDITKLETHMEKNAKEQLKWMIGSLFAFASVIIAVIKLL